MKSAGNTWAKVIYIKIRIYSLFRRTGWSGLPSSKTTISWGWAAATSLGSAHLPYQVPGGSAQESGTSLASRLTQHHSSLMDHTPWEHPWTSVCLARQLWRPAQVPHCGVSSRTWKAQEMHSACSSCSAPPFSHIKETASECWGTILCLYSTMAPKPRLVCC